MSPKVTPLVVSDDVTTQHDIDGLVEELRHICCATGLSVAVQVGHLVLERLYGGDSKLWSARGAKDVSLRKLQEHPDLPFRASALSKAVAVYLLSTRRADLLEGRYLGPSHLHEVLPLPAEQQ